MITPLYHRPAVITGGFLWITTIQFFILQFVVQGKWTTPFSLSKNFISDLGAVHTGEFPAHSGNFIGSPAHGLMNASFILFGLAVATGAAWISKGIKEAIDTKLTRSIKLCFFVGGIGVVLVGIFPEDTIIAMHGLGALLQVSGTSIGFILAGRLIKKTGFVMPGVISIITGIISPIAFIATLLSSMMKGPLLGLYLGSWERIAIWPEPVWFFVAGLVCCFKILKSRAIKTRKGYYAIDK